MQACSNTFMDLWYYGNVYTDEGFKEGGQSTKEFADAVVVFENNILIFSDKACSFGPETGDLDESKPNWRRWYSRAVLSSIKQLAGAISWLRRYPNRLYLDSTCNTPFPDKINLEDARIYLIATARTKSNRSLPQKILLDTSENFEEFSFGKHFTDKKDFVHVFEASDFEIIFKELDTVSDFIDYLEWRERLIFGSKVIHAKSELCLLAAYLTEDYHPEIFDHDYEDLANNSKYNEKTKKDKNSYAWDNIIKYSIQKSYAMGSYKHLNNDYVKNLYKLILQIMAKENRSRRRSISCLLSYVFNGYRNKFVYLTFKATADNVQYIFVLGDYFFTPSESDLDARINYLRDLCLIEKNRNRNENLELIVAIETPSLSSRRYANHVNITHIICNKSSVYERELIKKFKPARFPIFSRSYKIPEYGQCFDIVFLKNLRTKRHGVKNKKIEKISQMSTRKNRPAKKRKNRSPKSTNKTSSDSRISI